MNFVMFYLTMISAAVVLLVLVGGLRTMLLNKSPNLSQQFMRWRVGLQFATILLIMGCVYVAR